MPVSHSKPGELLGHPKGLFVLFFTEMWERFSYYGMRALLVLYMVNYFKWTQEDASRIYKWYTSLVYLTPLLGGYLADRYLGNKRAIIIGSTLMAIGHFCMAFEQHTIFYAALVFLILGNGFFKPNMSVQVGRLYPANDPRRDSAYTIFYMGINLGAFLSPLVCDWLRVNTKWSYHAGFTAAGIGMVLGLICYLAGLRWVEEVPEGEAYQADEDAADTGKQPHYMSEDEASITPSAVPLLSANAPLLFVLVALISIVGSVVLWMQDIVSWDNALAFAVGGSFATLMGAYILRHVSLALRDRVFVVYLVGIFVIFFWAAFEQAGNAMNVFADKTTDRYLTQEAPESDIYPPLAGAEVESISLINPVPTGWFQSINPFAIFVMAPFFAWLWVYLPRHGIHLSIPAKVGIGVFLQGVAFALMMWSIQFENQPSSSSLAALPSGVTINEKGSLAFRDAPELGSMDDLAEELADFSKPIDETAELKVVHGGRIHFDDETDSLNMTGVLADTDRDRMLRATVSPAFLAKVWELANKSQDAKKAGGEFNVSVVLDEVPEAIDLRYSGLPDDKLSLDPQTRTLSTSVELLDKDYKAILVAGSDSALRNALNEVYVASAAFKVSSLWLLVFYILCTVGELCLSPVGLSMVSKLAPAKFATMLMGVWLMTSFFGNFVAGLAGEHYGTHHPAEYFMIVAVIVGGAALVCALFVKKMKAMMHGVE